MAPDKTPADLEREAARASDIEQTLGHGGNLRDAGPGAEAPDARPHDLTGGSGHTPRREEILPAGAEDRTGSPGADADRDAVGGAAT